MADKKKYWLKATVDLPDDKYFRKIYNRLDGNGVWIYMRMMFISLNSDCHILLDGLDPEEEEIAEEIGEKNIGLVRELLDILYKYNQIEKEPDGSLHLIQAEGLSEGESASAERVRRFRKGKKEKEPLHCNGQALHCNTDVTYITDTDTETEREKEKDRDKNKDKEQETKQDIHQLHTDANEKPVSVHVPVSVSFPSSPVLTESEDLYTVEQLWEVVKENFVNLSAYGTAYVWKYWHDKNWMMNGEPVGSLDGGILRSLRGMVKSYTNNPDMCQYLISTERKPNSFDYEDCSPKNHLRYDGMEYSVMEYYDPKETKEEGMFPIDTRNCYHAVVCYDPDDFYYTPIPVKETVAGEIYYYQNPVDRQWYQVSVSDIVDYWYDEENGKFIYSWFKPSDNLLEKINNYMARSMNQESSLAELPFN